MQKQKQRQKQKQKQNAGVLRFAQNDREVTAAANCSDAKSD
jgi:hypothetical protein